MADDEEEVLREGWLDKRAGLMGYGSRWFRLSRDISGRHYLRYAWNPSRGWRKELSLEGAIVRDGESPADGITVTTKDQAPEPGQDDGMSTNPEVVLQLTRTETNTESHHNEKEAQVASLAGLFCLGNVLLIIAKANLHKTLIAVTFNKNQNT